MASLLYCIVSVIVRQDLITDLNIFDWLVSLFRMDKCSGNEARRGKSKQVKIRHLLPINLLDIPIVPICILRIQCIVSTDGIVIDLAPSDKLIRDADTVESQALAIVSAECREDLQRVVLGILVPTHCSSPSA